MNRILVVEDEAGMRRILTVLFEKDGHEVLEADTVQKGLAVLTAQPLDLVITDQRLPDGDGLSLLAAAKDADPTLPVIMITAYATIELAVTAMREGAFDFITKPFNPDTVRAAVARACSHAALLRENERLRDEVERLAEDTELLGDSPAMREVREFILRAAPTNATVLIRGETGTGKELVARAIHNRSQRSNHPFVAVNCAAMPEDLLESQLFGHERGSFTGADQARQGLFEAAHKGTLFLDEAGEMSLGLQAKLLRVLTDGEILRVGSTTPRNVDVRIIAATHRDLESRVREGQFREDLYFRLAVVPLTIPPLRDRSGDIPVLVEHFLGKVAKDLKVPRRTIAPEAVDALGAYSFPGNVRELRNLIERAYILGRGAELGTSDFPATGMMGPALSAFDRVKGPCTLEDVIAALPGELNVREVLDRLERDLLIRALDASGGAQAEAARKLGLTRSDMTYKVRKYDIRDHTAR
ncbi:MAG: sigma-54-dependent Fis family transcriptional regulator [Candidatus Hydrogenedentes bacterium]|nr:sigma-54-dependent Fis family transcriptional regulator [Candidatus Hydrogenedentota bacterium]